MEIKKMKMYYTEYILETQESTITGDIYFIDTGFGIIELGGVCNGKAFCEEEFWPISYNKYIKDCLMADKHSIVRVL